MYQRKGHSLENDVPRGTFVVYYVLLHYIYFNEHFHVEVYINNILLLAVLSCSDVISDERIVLQRKLLFHYVRIPCA